MCNTLLPSHTPVPTLAYLSCICSTPCFLLLPIFNIQLHSSAYFQLPTAFSYAHSTPDALGAHIFNALLPSRTPAPTQHCRAPVQHPIASYCIFSTPTAFFCMFSTPCYFSCVCPTPHGPLVHMFNTLLPSHTPVPTAVHMFSTLLLFFTLYCFLESLFDTLLAYFQHPTAYFQYPTICTMHLFNTLLPSRFVC